MADIKEVLEDLKKNGKVKEYAAPPEGIVEFDGWLLTYCLEKTLIGLQPTLAISKLDRTRFEVDAELGTAIKEVFGTTVMLTNTTFQMRGPTIILSFRQ